MPALSRDLASLPPGMHSREVGSGMLILTGSVGDEVRDQSRLSIDRARQTQLIITSP